MESEENFFHAIMTDFMADFMTSRSLKPPELRRRGKERRGGSIPHFTCRGRQHLSNGPSALEVVCAVQVMGTLRDLQFALQLKIEELRQRDTLIDELELELDTKDELIRRLQEELDRYRASVVLPGPSAASAGDDDLPGANRKTVISESFTLDSATTFSPKICDKSQERQELIQAAFLKSELLKNLDEDETRAVTACMYPTIVHHGCCVIQEGSSGSQAYVLEEGRLDMTKDGQKLLTIEPGEAFGEVALLYNCTQVYSVTAQLDSKLWVIDRKCYQTLLMQRGHDSLARTSELLSSVPSLLSLPKDAIMKMCDLMEEAHYTEGDYIIRQGASGDTFYIINKGQVKVTEKKPGDEEEMVLSRLSERKWFGEKALWGEDVRTVNVIAASDVACLLIDRETFRDIIDGTVLDTSHEMEQNIGCKDESGVMDPASLSSSTLTDFQIISTLGTGEFGHIDLVQVKSNIKCLYAMRILKKTMIIHNGLRERVLKERNILMDARCPFLVRLHKTFRDAECLYMLTEACLHGDLYSLLKDKGFLDESSTKFYTACVTQALAFLHSRNVVYRDVKPENVVVDERGYAKLIGSRSLKKVEVGKKTYTFCGTPGYMAPEVILNKGHSVSADFWSLGVFVFELLTGGLPFSGVDPMRILSETVRGIDHIAFPKAISKSASILIKKLCRRNPSERLGSQRNGAKDIQKHKWFEGFNWDGLSRGTLNPPLTPKVKDVLNSSSTCGHYTGDAAELCTTWEDF
ncbi:cGMP-dependent protein kinase 1 isoform X2 [Dunckerocampus dactyliophorus]|uniref:cGMP-dependent protein kinase 1 isoform X2 n=1 Tax=Dunckerocampus dactyliophorus TaxID=161453 RepID=UPI002405617E|nr:cGMP-dependent protein kinase 1 isoform X2 [Dunckerocampus dactyliophorus]